MTDRELLELAAKAAGIDANLELDGTFSIWEDVECIKSIWNPLTDDGDAMRMAVTLKINVLHFGSMTTAKPAFSDWGCDERDDGSPYVATRRAIVRAAAEIGKGMK